MCDVIEPPKKEVVIKCAGLSTHDKIELETFLKSQPNIKEVRRRQYTMDHAFPPDTIGLIIAIPWDLVVVLSDSVKEAAPSVVPLIGLYYLARKDRMQQDKERKQLEDDNIESVAIADPSGRVVSIIKREKSKA